jgi:hypothetical protein
VAGILNSQYNHYYATSHWVEWPVRVGVVPPLADCLQARRNVMFADGLPPAVIDWPVYHRPASWASAVVIVDALVWQGAPADLLTRWADRHDGDQLLIRALMYRMATNEGCRRAGLPVRERAEHYRQVVELVIAQTR